MKMNRDYHNLFLRADVAGPNYYMRYTPLPDYIHLIVTQTTSNKYLTVYSSVHQNKKVRMNPSYSLEFTDREIIKDLSLDIYKRFIN